MDELKIGDIPSEIGIEGMVVVHPEPFMDMDPRALHIGEDSIHVEHHKPGHGAKIAERLIKRLA
jgi:hypothetical protein